MATAMHDAGDVTGMQGAQDAQGQQASQEPQLKYERLGGDVPSIISKDKASCLKASAKILALGTQHGGIHILDYSGNEVKRLQSSSSAIIDLSFDRSEEYLASCSQDGVVMIYNLYTDKSTKYEFKWPVRAVCLDPRYAQRKTCEFATANTKGKLTMRSQGWFGRTDTVLHQGEGSIHAIVWGGSTLAWANDIGVRVYDTNAHVIASSIDRPKHGAHAEHLHCSLLLLNERDLYIGWPDCVAVALLVDVPNASGTLSKQVELLTQFSTSYLVTGVAPYGEDLAVLTYMVQQAAASTSVAADDAGGNASSSEADGAGQQDAQQQQQQQQQQQETAPRSPAAEGASSHSTTARNDQQPSLESEAAAADQAASQDSLEPASASLEHAAAAKLGPAAASEIDSLPEAGSAPAPAAAAVQQGAAGPGPGSLAAQLHAARHQRSGSFGTQQTAAQRRLQQVRSRQARLPPRPLKPELRVVTWLNQEKAADIIDVAGHEALHPSAYSLVASYPEGTEVGRVWSSQQELLYYVVSPQDVVLGRPRGAADRVAWLLEHQRFDAALEIACAERAQQPDMYEQVINAYLEHLFAEEQHQQAAQLCPRLLLDLMPCWERWVYMFAQARQLVLLAPHLPTQAPQLRPMAYSLALTSLLHSRAHHAQLLQLVHTWPAQLYSQAAFVQEIKLRLERPGQCTRELQLVLAELYQQQCCYDDALCILLELREPGVFDFIQQHSLLHSLNYGGRAVLLLAADEVRAVELLVASHEAVPPHSVVPGVLEVMQAALERGEQEAAQLWRRRLHEYLHALFLLEPSAAADFHELQVPLYADYAPARLMAFLASSQHYPLEAALEVCAARGLVSEQVYVLSRMGSCQQALQLIIECQRDVPAAIEFVQGQADEELWEALIGWALGSPSTTAQLLDHIGGHINPLKVIEKIPLGMQVPQLRDRLRRIIADFRTQSCLREGCSAILRSDCLHLMQRLQREVRRACPLVYVQHTSGRRAGQWQRCSGGALEPVAAAEVPAQALAGAMSDSSERGLPLDVRSTTTSPELGTPPPPPQQQQQLLLRGAFEATGSARAGKHRRSGSASSGNLQNISAALSTLSSQQAKAAESSSASGIGPSTPMQQQVGSQGLSSVASTSAVMPVKLWVGLNSGAASTALVLGTSSGPAGRGHARSAETGSRPLPSLLEV